MPVADHHRVIVARRGGPGVLEWVEHDLPEPRDTEVLIDVLTAGVSALDVMVRSRSFPGFPRVPFTPGADVVGTVVAAGKDVTGIEPGTRMVGLLGTGGGGYASHVCMPATDAVPVPHGVDSVQAVCLAANYVTAYAMLHRAAEVHEGDRILIQGASGGVGTALLELGRLAGLEMYGTASEHNLGLVSSLGATPIDYHSEDFVECILQLTGDGVDAVFDPIGGGKQLRRSYRTLRKGGRLVWFGVAAASKRGVRVIPASLAMRLLLSIIPDGKKAPMPPDGMKPNDWYRATLTHLLKLLEKGDIEPLVAATFPLSEASRAHEMLESGGHVGKVVLTNPDRFEQ